MYRYGLDYDRGWGTQRRPYRSAPMSGYGRDFGPNQSFGRERGFDRGRTFGMEFGRNRQFGEPGYRGSRFGYGQEYTTYGLGYDRDFQKSRWETDYGDPFNDRARGTPIRTMRGEWEGYGREYRGREIGPAREGYGYGRTYRPRWRY